MAKPTIEVFDENAIDKLVRMYEDSLRRIQMLEQRESVAVQRPQAQPIIGKATGAAGIITGTYKINAYHGPYRNAANDADGEFAAYLVEAKPWAGAAAPVAGDKVALWQTPFGQWYYVKISGATGVGMQTTSFFPASSPLQITGFNVAATGDDDTAREFYVDAVNYWIHVREAVKLQISFHAHVISLVTTGSASNNTWARDRIAIELREGNGAGGTTAWVHSPLTFEYIPQQLLTSGGQTVTTIPAGTTADYHATGSFELAVAAGHDLQLWFNATFDASASHVATDYYVSEAWVNAVKVG